MSSSELATPYRIIADRIMDLLAQGHIPWRKPWLDTGLPKSLSTGRPYRGINLFLLACTAAMQGYRSAYWLTFQQCRQRGGHVRRGEKGTPVVFWKLWKPGTDEVRETVEPAESAESEEKVVPVLRYYTVFNVRQCEGIEAPEPPGQSLAFEPMARCESVVAGMPRPPVIRHGESRACYAPASDRVSIPEPRSFTSREDYYATLFHELVHSTGHPDRLHRAGLGELAGFGSEPYGREELVAEMGSAFLCGHCGIEQAVLENAAAYMDGWLTRLRKDPKILVIAAAQAQKAADYILGRKSDATETVEGAGEPSPAVEEAMS